MKVRINCPLCDEPISAWVWKDGSSIIVEDEDFKPNCEKELREEFGSHYLETVDELLVDQAEKIAREEWEDARSGVW